jgi:hypothetical protein
LSAATSKFHDDTPLRYSCWLARMSLSCTSCRAACSCGEDGCKGGGGQHRNGGCRRFSLQPEQRPQGTLAPQQGAARALAGRRAATAGSGRRVRAARQQARPPARPPVHSRGPGA